MSTVLLSFDVGIRNLAVCKVSVEADDSLHIFHWDVMDVLEGAAAPTSKKLSIPDTARHMIDTLSKNESVFLQNPAPTAILIEQQPGGKFVNVGMKALSHVLQSFMYIKAPHIPIHFVSARKKLQTAESHEKGTAQKKRYTSNKQFAKEAALDLIQTRVVNREEAHSIFTSRSKKDDLADSLLQAVSFCAAPPPKKRRTKK